jgi:hypothetical protein
MESSLEFGGDPQDVTLSLSGTATAEGIEAGLAELLSDPRFRPGMAVLIDNSSLDTKALGPSDIKAMADAFARAGEQLGPAAVAVLTGGTGTPGLVSLWESYSSHAKTQSRIFNQRDDAVAWLREQKRAD